MPSHTTAISREMLEALTDLLRATAEGELPKYDTRDMAAMDASLTVGILDAMLASTTGPEFILEGWADDDSAFVEETGEEKSRRDH
jgi:hypothetical protein